MEIKTYEPTTEEILFGAADKALENLSNCLDNFRFELDLTKIYLNGLHQLNTKQSKLKIIYNLFLPPLARSES